jgi:hypothetical protein
MDESYKVAITRLGDRIRVGGTAEISGYSSKLYAARRATLDHSLTELFPRGGDLRKATFWSGLRPMTPDGPPVIGPTRTPTCTSTPATARSAGPWRAARGGCSRTCCRQEAGHRRRRADGGPLRTPVRLKLDPLVIARSPCDEAIQSVSAGESLDCFASHRNDGVEAARTFLSRHPEV